MSYLLGAIIWVVLSYFVGKFSANKAIGFWGGFLISLLVSPLVGFIVALVAPTR